MSEDIGASDEEVGRVGGGGKIVFYACEAAVCPENSSGIGPVECGDVFSPSDGVEESPAQECGFSGRVGQILMEHQEVVPKIEECLAGV